MFRRELIRKVDELMQALTDHGVQVAKFQIRELDAVYTTELLNSIEGYYSPSWGVGVIKAGAGHAAFVEFGTGVIGQDSPHPNPGSVGWQYDASNRGKQGWFYFNDNDGQVHWTAGYKSRPFMYNTARELEKVCGKIAREVFNR